MAKGLTVVALTLSALVLGSCSVAMVSQTGEDKRRVTGANLLEDPGFEEGSPRFLRPTDPTPWTGEEDQAVVIMRGKAHAGRQFLRMKVAEAAGNQAFAFNRFRATPHTDYTLTFWTRGTPHDSITASVRARFLGDCHTAGPGGTNICPDEDGDEDLDLGPEPPDYPKLLLVVTTVSGSEDWTPVSLTFHSGKYTELAVVFFGVFGGGHIDIDDVSVVETPPPDSPAPHSHGHTPPAGQIFPHL
jgi:hypothetical protein